MALATILPAALAAEAGPLPSGLGARSLVPGQRPAWGWLVWRLLQIIPAPRGRWPPAVGTPKAVVFREPAVTEEGLEPSSTWETVEQGRTYGVRTVSAQLPQEPYEADRVALVEVRDGIAGEQGSDLCMRAHLLELC